MNDTTSVIAEARPVIHRIILHNFKSYFGTQVLGPFDNHFTSIVGANGNGKSNSIDAIQFVFGKRGKQMRANKVRELVWQGSLELEARVEIVFRFVLVDKSGTEHYEMDGDSIRELKIARIIPAGSTSSSRYQINDRTTTYLGVQEALKSLSIEPTNDRFLILQGEVEAISQMKSMELLEYLSNIIGTTEYTEPIEEAKKRLDQSSQDRDIQYDRLRHNEAILDALEGPVGEAKVITRKRIQKNEVIYQQRLINHAQACKNITLCKKDLSETRERKSQITEQILKRQRDSRDHEVRYTNLRQHYDRLVTVMEECKQNVHRFDNEKVHLTKEIKNTKNRLAKLKQTGSESEEGFLAKIKSCEERHESLQKELKAVENHLEIARSSLIKLTQEYESQYEPISKEIEKTQQLALPFSSKISQLEGELAIKMDLRDRTIENAANRERDKRAIYENKSKIEEECSQLKHHYETSSHLLQETKDILTKRRLERDSLSSQMIEKEKLKRATELEVSELDQTAEHFRSFNLVYDTLMGCKQNNTIRGICDKLANCGVVDEKYKVALYAACQHMNFIITDDGQAAASCVEYLQKHKVGIGRFIMLDRLNHLKEKMNKNIKNLPSGSKRLFDLITFKDEKFKPAFYFALKDTLVAEDIHEARRLAFGGSKRHCVVTLKGELIETTGTMSSGSNLQHIMLMTTISTTTQEKRAQLRKITEEYEAVISSKTEVERDLSALEERFRETKFETEKLQFRLSKVEKSLENIEKTLLEFHADTSNGEILPLDELNQQIDALQEEISDNREKYSEYNSILSQLKEKQESIGGVSMQDHRTKIELLEKQLEDIKSKVAKNLVKKSQLEKQMEKSVEDAQKTEEQKLSFETKLAELESNLTKLIEDGTSLQTDYQTAEEEKIQMERQLRSLDDEQDEIQSKYQSLKMQETEISIDEKNLLQKLSEYEKQRVYWRKEMDKTIQALSKEWSILKTFDIEVPHKDEKDDEAVEETAEDEDSPMKDVSNEEEDVQLCDELRDFVKRFEEISLEQFNEEELSTTLQTIEAELYQYSDKSSRVKALVEDYNTKKEAYIQQYKMFSKLSEERNKIQSEFDGLRHTRLEKFMQGFTQITLKLKEIYQMITMGGDAELELVDRHDPFKAGIIFSVKPPRKSWRKIQNLSGGEKTLSSLALIFALHHYKPTPLYIMDEIDAALDYRNVAIVGHYIKQRTKNAQFIVISLRNSMFELSDRLVGIFKVNNKTQSVSVQPKKIIAQAREDSENIEPSNVDDNDMIESM